LALIRIQGQIDILVKKVPLLIDKEIEKLFGNYATASGIWHR
jgi:hypothetical protein